MRAEALSCLPGSLTRPAGRSRRSAIGAAGKKQTLAVAIVEGFFPGNMARQDPVLRISPRKSVLRPIILLAVPKT